MRIIIISALFTTVYILRTKSTRIVFFCKFVKSKVKLQVGQDIFDLLYNVKKGITILFLLITSQQINLFFKNISILNF